MLINVVGTNVQTMSPVSGRSCEDSRCAGQSDEMCFAFGRINGVTMVVPANHCWVDNEHLRLVPHIWVATSSICHACLREGDRYDARVLDAQDITMAVSDKGSLSAQAKKHQPRLTERLEQSASVFQTTVTVFRQRAPKSIWRSNHCTISGNLLRQLVMECES